MSDHRRQIGFTLLELMISISILAVLMVFSNQSIQNGLRAKLKIHEQVEDMSSVRDALLVMERDINLAYHYRDIETELKTQVQKTGSAPPAGAPPGSPPSPPPQPGQPGQPNPQAAFQAAIAAWTRKDPTRVDPTTQFIGSGDAIHFVTMYSSRMDEETAQADFIKVGYYLSSCRKPGSTGTSSKCLLRSSSPLVEGDITQNGPADILLENITEFKLRYIGASKEDWVSDWNSKEGDGGTINNFPDAVEISLTVTKGNDTKKRKSRCKSSRQCVLPTIHRLRRTELIHEKNYANKKIQSKRHRAAAGDFYDCVGLLFGDGIGLRNQC